jgi:anti-sigma factor RsiW
MIDRDSPVTEEELHAFVDSELPADRQEAVTAVLNFCREALGLTHAGTVPSALLGPKGNQEYLAYLRRG